MRRWGQQEEDQDGSNGLYVTIETLSSGLRTTLRKTEASGSAARSSESEGATEETAATGSDNEPQHHRVPALN